MPVAFLFEGDGIGQDEYDRLMERVGRAEVDGARARRFIAHFAGPTDGGWRAVDVWESEQAAGAFYGWPLHRVEIGQTMRDLAAM
jgi:hypothetical protein